MNKIDINEQDNRRTHYEELVKLMPFKSKVYWAKKKIKEFINECEKDQIKEITISFSGGKDSTVLLDLVLKTHAEMHSTIPLVPVYATEITFPSTFTFIKETVRKYQEKYPLLKNENIVMPKKTWLEILSQNGYPIFSKQISTLINRVKKNKTKNNLTKWFFGIDKDKTSTAKFMLHKNRLFLLDDQMLSNWNQIITTENMQTYFKKYNDKYFFSEKCCDFIKGNLKHDYRPSFIGTMAEESELRRKSWIKDGCNIYNKNKKRSRPLSIWRNNDIWRYIKENNLTVNEAYGFDINKPIDKQHLRFERLGCISCPYGSFIEQKKIEIISRKKSNVDNPYLLMNRFEILKSLYPNLYLSQVIKNGMYKIIIDMGIKIKDDPLYMKLFELRHQQINEWYSEKNFRNNILRIMCQIENHNDYKKKGNNYTWSYSLDEFKQALKHFGLNSKISKKEIDEIRKQIKLHHINQP